MSLNVKLPHNLLNTSLIVMFPLKNNYFPFYFQIQKFYTCSNKLKMLSKLRICDIDHEMNTKMSEKDKIIVLIIYENDK